MCVCVRIRHLPHSLILESSHPLHINHIITLSITLSLYHIDYIDHIYYPFHFHSHSHKHSFSLFVDCNGRDGNGRTTVGALATNHTNTHTPLLHLMFVQSPSDIAGGFFLSFSFVFSFFFFFFLIVIKVFFFFLSSVPSQNLREHIPNLAR